MPRQELGGRVAVSISANRAHVVQGLSAGMLQLLPGGSTSLVVSASDPDGDTLSDTGSRSDPAWAIGGAGAAVTVTAPFSNNRTTTLTVTISDGFGGSTSDAILVGTSACAGQSMNCDGDPANGCEADLTRDAANCGACAAACSDPTLPYCRDSACVGAIILSSAFTQNVAPTTQQHTEWLTSALPWWGPSRRSPSPARQIRQASPVPAPRRTRSVGRSAPAARSTWPAGGGPGQCRTAAGWS